MSAMSERHAELARQPDQPHADEGKPSVKHYTNSKGQPVEIALMLTPHLTNAYSKLVLSEPHRAAEIEAMWEELNRRTFEEGAVPVSVPVSPPAPTGHNNPPPPTSFEAVKVHIEDLYLEAKNWMDGQPIETQGQADAVGVLLDQVRKAHAAADEARKAEAKPFDDGKAEVQARYAPLISDTKAVRGKTVLATEACKAALAPWLRRQEQERQAEAERLRKAAEAKAAEAAEAARQAQGSADLDAMEAAELLVSEARQADRQASRAENDKAQATGGARAVTLRSYWTPVLENPSAALMHYARERPDELRAFLLSLAVVDVREGKRTLPGFRIDEERRPV